MASRNSGFDTGDLHWESYEELVKDIHLALGRADGVDIVCWGRNCQVEGLSGVPHQIDVLTRHSAGAYEYKTAIECKYWDRNVGIKVLREFVQIVQDADVHKGVVVSKTGFTGPAKTFAKAHNIELVELRKPVDKDWEGRIRVVPFVVTMILPPIHNISLRITVPKEHPDREVLQATLENVRVAGDRFFVAISGQEPKPLEELIDAEVRRQPNEENHDLQFPAGSVLMIPDNPEHLAHGHTITGVSVKVEQLPLISQEFEVNASDYIYMIMESIFDGRRFTITKNGEIIENKQWSDETAIEPR